MYDEQKYIRELKRLLNINFRSPLLSVVQVHLVGDVIVIDAKIKYKNLLHNQKVNMVYHDCFPMPKVIGYGTAKEQAEFIAGCYNSVLKTFYMID